MPADETFIETLSTLSRGMKSLAGRELGQVGVHPGQDFILRCLWEQDGQSPGELARRLGIEVPTVSKAIQRMEASGLITRHADPSDGRIVRAWLTTRGARLNRLVPQILGELEARALRDLSDHERTQLMRLLRKVRSTVAGDVS